MSKNGIARYLIAQYVRDPFRREARNIGVLVMKDGRTAAQFAGETEAGNLDLRRLQWHQHRQIYKHWVEYWREELPALSDGAGFEKLISQNGGNYNLIPGGELSDTGDDSPEAICRFLFASLVTVHDGSVVVEEEDTESPSKQLRADLFKELKARHIMGAVGEGGEAPSNRRGADTRQDSR